MPRLAQRILFVAPLLCGWLCGSLAAAQVERVRLELVLAVDSSSSVTYDEFDLQMEGIAGAFEDPRVLAAIEDSGPEGIAVTLLQWSSLRVQEFAVEWTHIRSLADSLAFAQRVRRAGRQVDGGATAMSTALTEAILALESNSFLGERRVIDVSGDGRANEGESPAVARAYANRIGITINGLAILNEEPRLARYYIAGVVGGPGSFLLTADDFEDFAESMRRKIYYEIVGPPIAVLPESPLYGELNQSPGSASGQDRH